MVCDSIQVVVMAGGKGSRMLDIAGGSVKCLLPVAGFPLVYYPLRMLEKSGFQNIILAVPDSARSEVMKVPERYKLSVKLDVVGIPGSEEWGTLDTLRHVEDKLSGSDVLIVSGDLITGENLRSLTDLHRAKRSGLTMLLNTPAFDLKALVVPGSKSNKYKAERDLIGLSGDRVCLFKSEADVEERINLPSRVLKCFPRFTVHTNLQDAHLYLVSRDHLAHLMADKTLTTVKGELIPKLVEQQFRTRKGNKEMTAMELDQTELSHRSRELTCYAAVADGVTLRVNNIPAYWEAFRLVKTGELKLEAESPTQLHKQAQIHPNAQMKECSVGMNSVVSEKTNLSGCAVGAGCVIKEKVILTNSIIMDGVTINSGVNIKDSIICEGACVEGGSSLSQCIVGKQFSVPASSTFTSQILLDADRMMQV